MRSCTNQPASSGRRERAYDWLEQIEVDREGEDSEIEEESENEAILEEEDEQNGSESGSGSGSGSGSELSQLASSQFNGIEVE